ncbi:hypothetical protein HO133_007068 [Letharia lupina]|uniref:LITAF domain-containing protein n=1 Tax=Letharia lupina TaxID=560253 RepID=A0A8H6FI50_9LECA|nr:uncharacterized protein HO133_007068 [Letharia lupina]KAF6228956.1 hypothetical protein HO133_007068 [Letharia lupina]
MPDKALAYQVGQVQGQGQLYSTNASRTTTMPAPTELREVGGGNAPSTKPPANTDMAYTSPPPMRVVGNAGLVRPTDGLGFEPDFVDCPNCRERRETIVNRVASETTRWGMIPSIGVVGVGGNWRSYSMTRGREMRRMCRRNIRRKHESTWRGPEKSGWKIRRTF